MLGAFSNTSKLTRFILRRERVTIGLWLAILLLVACISAVLETQPHEEIIQGLIARQNPIRVAIQGPVYGLEYSSAGNLFASQMLLFKMVAVAVMNIFMVIRHTRGDEEKGRYEVMLSLPVGRLAMLQATMIIAICVNVVVAATQGLILWILGISGIDIAGALTYGAVLGASGLLFAALAAFFAQLTHSSRDATNYIFIFLLIAYLVRAIGDTSNEILDLVSPLGLIMRAEVFAQNYLWPVFIVLVLALFVSGLAYLLNARRDIEQRTEQVLSGAVSKTKHLAGYVLIAFIASVLIPFLTTLGLWVVGFFMMDNPISFSIMLLAIIVYIPALWVVLGLTVFIVGRFPKAAILCWAYYAYIFVVSFFGDLLRLPEWAMRLSPIYFIPRLPLEEVNNITLLALTFVAGVLTLSGFIFYRRRDIKT